MAPRKAKGKGKVAPTVAIDETESRVPKQLTPWKPGQSGNPSGRPKGSRNKLGEAFIQDMYDKWVEKGAEVIDAAMEQSPGAFIRSMVAILPQEVHVKDDLSKLTNEELTDILTALRSLAFTGGDQQDTGGTSLTRAEAVSRKQLN
jgi:hypothetical protein